MIWQLRRIVLPYLMVVAANEYTVVYGGEQGGREMKSIKGTVGGHESSATGGRLFSMKRLRTYDGPVLDADGFLPGAVAEPFLVPASDTMCERWAVLTSIFDPTETVKQLAGLSDWCVVVVGDKKGPVEYGLKGVIYLTPADQQALPYRIVRLLPWNHFGRKNVGYLYAIHHGAKVIYDVDDDNALINPGEGVPHADPAHESQPLYFSGAPSTVVHNPYPCFGGSGNSWPRGFPLDAINDGMSSLCDVAAPASTLSKKSVPKKLAVVQALANHDPDVDAIYRLTYPPGGLPFDFDDSPTTLPGHAEKDLSFLRGVPEGALTPYNAQATLHFSSAFWGMLLPVTVHGRVSDIWRSYFTQALLPAVNAVVAFAFPSVAQVRNPHNYLSDFQAELPLYQQSSALVNFLIGYRRLVAADMASGAVCPSLWKRMEALAIDMYEHGIIDLADVELCQAWLGDLTSAGYVSPQQSGRGTHDPAAVDSSDSETKDGGGPTASITTANFGPDKKEPKNKPEVLLVIAVPSVRPERRQAIRESWLEWGDDRVILRFFTELPGEDEHGAEEMTKALEREISQYGDLVVLEISQGMNFGLKLVAAMSWMDERYSFAYFLRLDDDYFLCLKRLLDELDATTDGEGSTLPPLYAGWIYCEKATRVDEAYMLLSASLVRRLLDAPNLLCGSHGGMSAGWWFTEGNVGNPDGDVLWVHDNRLDHWGQLWKSKDTEDLSVISEVCDRNVGVHRTYSDQMSILWSAVAKTKGNTSASATMFTYLGTSKCPDKIKNGVSNADFVKMDQGGQVCESFRSNRLGVHCGGQGC